jgi:hypothetical protein
VAQSLSEGVREKLRRAHLHRKDFERRVDRFIERHAYEVVRDTDQETGQHVWIGEIHRQPPLIRWGAVIGDCLFNFRSALDHLAYDLAVAYSGAPLPKKVEFSSEFPIYWLRAPKVSELDNKIGAIHPEARDLIEQMQPYGRKGRAALKYLDALQNFDKHRTLHLVQASAVAAAFFGADDDPEIPFETLNFSPFVDGDVLARAKSKAQNDPVFTFGVAFSGEGPGAGYEVKLMLSWIGQHIEKTVIPPLLPYL